MYSQGSQYLTLTVFCRVKIMIYVSVALIFLWVEVPAYQNELASGLGVTRLQAPFP